jgi:adenine-specific DNA-methyltransferase
MTLELSNKLDVVRKSLTSRNRRQERSLIGQFLTPSKIARFMVSLFKQERENVRILDAGAGAGTLFAACVENLVSRKHRPHSIKVIAYESDKRILPYLQDTIDRCESISQKAGIFFQGELRSEDFIKAAIEQTEEGLFAVQHGRFTHAILNPPYKKINGESSTRRLLSAAGIEVSNLYAAFVWLSALMLEPKGEMVAITPRSFCNGPYFRRFRVWLLEMMSLRLVHVFESRKKAFGDDAVLQENVIFHAIREENKPERVIISSSSGLDFDRVLKRSVPYEYVILPDDQDAFIRLLLKDSDEIIMNKMRCFSTSLSKLGLDVSTGRVVDFRAKEYLRTLPEEDAMPLIYPCHFKDGFINWPADSGKKPNAIINSKETKELMVEPGYYVLTRRFSYKEERRRVVAAVYDPSKVKAKLIGFENHLNYFHERGKGLSPNLAKGLALYLNSSLFDLYFRLFSGHTQVNATDLRKIRYPSRDQLLRLGSHIQHRMPDQEMLDVILERECQCNG